MTCAESASTAVSRRGSTGGDAACTVVWVCGEHDIATRVALAVTLARAAKLEDVPLLVDLSGVTFMDASTVGALVAATNWVRSRGQSLHLRTASPRAMRLLEVCGLSDLIQQLPVPAGAAALASWIDIGPIARTKDDTLGVFAPAERVPGRVLVSADAPVGEPAAAAEVYCGGP
jgi:anti-sigma B factor antagonist